LRAARRIKPVVFLSLLFSPAAPAAILFSNATVIDVERGELRPAMSVVVTSNRITAVRDNAALHTDVEQPRAGTRVIDCSGKFLLPGLWDMHVHVLWEGAKEFLPVCVANGITGVRDLHTTMDLREAAQLRREIEKGTQVGPRLIYSGPLVDGPDPFWPGATVVTNAVSGRAEVRRLHAAGVDMVKVYEHLGRDTYFAITDECKRLGLLFGGHVPQSVNAFECSDAGQRTIEHLSDVLPWCSRQPGENDSAPDPDPARTARLQRAITTAMRGQPDTNLWPQQNLGWFNYEGGRIWRERMRAKGDLQRAEFLGEEKRSGGSRCVFRMHFEKESSLMTIDFTPDNKVSMARPDYVFDDEKARPVLNRFRTNKTWHCPTLSVHTGSYRDLEEVKRDPRRRYYFEEILRKSKYDEQRPASASTKKRFEQYLRAVKAMNAARVGLLAGTDTPLGSLPGFALHTELELLVRAGLSPAEALRAATLAPARCFERDHELGTVAPGKLADLLVLNANPLDDIRNNTRIETVVINGRVYESRET
jgi:hypothetical protein